MRATLRVTGMTCGGCENAVMRAVRQLPGVSSVTASRQQEHVEVDYDPSQVDLAAIGQKITKLGYQVADQG